MNVVDSVARAFGANYAFCHNESVDASLNYAQVHLCPPDLVFTLALVVAVGAIIFMVMRWVPDEGDVK